MRRLLLPWLLLLAPAAAASPRGVVLADFESGQVVLESYDPGEDREPDAWELTGSNTHDGSEFSLRLYGDTWKAQPIPAYPVQQGTVLSVAAYVEETARFQGFGVSDGVNALLYAIAGTDMPSGDAWDVAYEGAFPTGAWNVYMLPIGRDWVARYGYEPAITRLVYVNDRDEGDRGITLFDDVVDATSDLPIAPIAEIVRGEQRVKRIGADLFRVGIAFHAEVHDPDSQTFTYAWDFGDSTTSAEPDPYHTFTVTSDHTYTVRLAVRDDTGLWGRDSAQVGVDPGENDPLIRLDFAGDVMLARGYDSPGGLIDQHGPEWIFAPTRALLGGAADVTMCNLECPLTDRGVHHPTKPIYFRGRPSNVRGLVSAGIDLVSIANNHIVDYGREGMDQTQAVLDSVGIRWMGAGDDEYLAFQPAFWTERGVAIAVLGMCNRTGREYDQQPFLDAAYDKPGFAYLIEPRLGDAIASVRPLADLVVLQLHSGIEYDDNPGKNALPGEEPPFEAPAPGPEPASFRFPTRPASPDRVLRWHAVDEGANLVICHHPHVLQGFEVYHGTLIAHSLGDFVFDLGYAETMPSVILYADLDKTGFRSFTFRPVFIDDWVPRPATGQLGREILDRVADYSRELNTVVGVDPEALEGTIFLDPQGVSWSPSTFAATAATLGESGWWVSSPIERRGEGTLSRVLEVDGPGGAQVRVGREILWHGGFEDEGATYWDLNSADEIDDPAVAHGGARSLRQHRTSGNTGNVVTDLEGYPPTLGGAEFSILGWIKTQNARNAKVTARLFAGRGGQPLESIDAGLPITGTSDWTCRLTDFQAPENAAFFNVRCQMDKPATGEAYGWYDDLRLVEWEPWQAAALPLAVPYPSNLRFIQVRFPSPADSARVVWEDVRAGESPSAVFGDPPAVRLDARIEEARPNPFRDRVAIEYLLPRTGRARLEVFDVAGRRVALLADGQRTGGRHQVWWDATGAPSGLYLCRLTTAGGSRTGKLVRFR